MILQAETFFWILEIGSPRTSSVTQEAQGRRALSGASDAGLIPEKRIDFQSITFTLVGFMGLRAGLTKNISRLITHSG